MDIKRLRQKIELLAQRVNAHIPTICAIEQWLLTNRDDFVIYRITPKRVAADMQLSTAHVISEFLHAVPLGLFDLNWDIHCPHCYMITTTHAGLQHATGLGYCKMCESAFDTDFSIHVEVTFSLNSAIDMRTFPPVCDPPPTIEDRFNLAATYLQQVEAEEEFLEAGEYHYLCPISSSKGKLLISDSMTDTLQTFIVKQLDSRFEPAELHAQKGKIRIILMNLTYPISGFHVFLGNISQASQLHRAQILSGVELLHYTDFRKLFGEQVLSKRERMRIALVTLVFTDITGSTQLYERLGDTKAYNIVRDHFEILFSNIEAEGGIVLKTIGDAVMASFTHNDAALRSAVGALRAFETYNHDLTEDAKVQIKIGIHQGSVILVNLNERLDYFGSTVNKAARIQGIAQSGEICFSDTVYQDHLFQYNLTQLPIASLTHELIHLKGVIGTQKIYKTCLADMPD